MTKQLVKKEVDLTVLDTGDELDKKLAWNVAQLIAEADSDVRMAKGKFWSNCNHGTRKVICDHFEWKYSGMQEYARYAKEMSTVVDISYTHWKNAVNGGALQGERPALLEKAVKKGWTPVQVTEAARKIKEKRVGQVTAPVVVPKLTDEEMEEAKKAFEEEAAANAAPRKPKKMSSTRAFEVFGMGPTSWMSHRTFDLIYRGLAKDLHPDKGGSADDMAELNEAKEIIEGYVK